MKKWQTILLNAALIGVTSVAISSFTDQQKMQSSADEPAAASDSDTIILTGKLGSNLKWTCDGEVLTISGKGGMAQLGRDVYPWKKNGLSKSIVKIVVEEGVTEIAPNAFSECSSVQFVELPDTLKVIDEYAFDGDDYLEVVHVPASVDEVHKNAFNCKNLKHIYFWNSFFSIYADGSTVGPKTVVHSYANSTGFRYAEKFEKKFIDIGTITNDECIVNTYSWTQVYGSSELKFNADIYDDSTVIIRCTNEETIEKLSMSLDLGSVCYDREFYNQNLLTNEFSYVYDTAGSVVTHHGSSGFYGLNTTDTYDIFKRTLNIDPRSLPVQNVVTVTFTPNEENKGKETRIIAFGQELIVNRKQVSAAANPYDVNADGRANILDMVLMKNYLMGEE